MDILYYKLFDIWEIHFMPIHFILIFLVVVGYRIARKYIRKNLRPILQDQSLKIDGKEIALYRLVMQLLQVATAFLVFYCLTVKNPAISLDIIMQTELFKANTFKITIGQIVFIIVLFFVARAIINIIKIFMVRAMNRRKIEDETKRYTLLLLTKFLIYFIVTVIGIKNLGVDITWLIYSSSALFVGLGLGLQTIFLDIMSGFIILFEGTIKIGDIIETDNMVARVKKINIRTSLVRTRDGILITVPNSRFTKENIINWSNSDTLTRFKINVRAAFGSDTSLVKELLHRAALEHPAVDKRSHVQIFLSGFGENALEFELYFWANKKWEIPNVQSDIRFRIDQLFREHNVTIPYPQRDLHIKSNQGL
ncbi:MAG: mechanosensitive ion channel family protein [Flavobacteriales bacterium]